MAQGLLSYETFVKSVAGASGSIIAMSVFYPLDTIRFRLQIEDDNAKELKKMNSLHAVYHIIRTEGIEALYRGMKPVLQSLGASNFVYFYTFHGLKSITTGSALHDLGLGMIAGMANVLATLPLWVVNSRLKANKSEHFSGLLDGVVHIAQKEGVSALWNGLGPSLMLVINPAIHFAVYEALKRNVKTSSATVFFLFGAISKAVATVATYPIQLAQARQRHGKNSQMSTAALLLSILKRNGPAALFQGMEAKLLQTVLTAALFFMTYEKIVRFVFMLLMRKG
ncbi:PREDICTED: peroxisomal membrane protein PMP34 [Nicrophorus vespilloides]|uniref:Peroxisomal membrane protein PMP34 n=1 Tax=Nicrophorus vespilloides TaxID=110193 RepID=A0ABM1NJW6_NICVS|nr:PREDICTED: peroxisomal membrane protein PMP34 [Nicrophorus vespilloides]